jgi:hypothetical protein
VVSQITNPIGKHTRGFIRCRNGPRSRAPILSDRIPPCRAALSGARGAIDAVSDEYEAVAPLCHPLPLAIRRDFLARRQRCARWHANRRAWHRTQNCKAASPVRETLPPEIARAYASVFKEPRAALPNGATRSGPAYLAADFAFTNHWMSTDRIVVGDHLTADFNAQSYGGRLEGG